jgi:hypothetical protein
MCLTTGLSVQNWSDLRLNLLSAHRVHCRAAWPIGIKMTCQRLNAPVRQRHTGHVV